MMIGWFLAFLLTHAALAPSGAGTFREADPAQTGVTWVHNNALSDHRYLPETEPPGVAIFDFDNDGWMDLFFVNTGSAVFFHPQTPPRHALYRNNRNGTFTDVTQQAGITADLFGMGAVAGEGWSA